MYAVATPTPIVATAGPAALRTATPCIRMQQQQRPPQQLGRLRFGAARGPEEWIVDRDGEWSPGYWVELEGGPDDGRTIPVPLAQIEDGLKEGDACAIENLDDADDADGTRVRCVKPSPLTGFRFENSSTPPMAPGSVALRNAARPVVTVVVVLAAGLVLSRFAPRPSLLESQQRCERLLSGFIEVGDREGAESWLSACALSRAEGEELLSDAWQSRWQGKEPPTMVQGVPTR